jgi:hypothetical protein
MEIMEKEYQNIKVEIKEDLLIDKCLGKLEINWKECYEQENIN